MKKLIYILLVSSAMLVHWKPNPGPQTEVLRRSEDEILFGGSRGGGKVQPLYSKIVTPFGLRAMGDMQIGSIITNPSGRPQKVISIFPQGIIDVYRIYFCDGAYTDVGPEHLWMVKIVGRVVKNKNTYFFSIDENLFRIVTTIQLISIVQKRESSQCTTTPHIHIPLCNPLTFTKSYKHDFRIIEPYLLGVILGDGSVTSSSGPVKMTTADPEIIQKIKKYGYEISHNAEIEYSIVRCNLKNNLKRLKLWGCKSFEKFIPDCYKLGTLDQRKELVCGLMDTDGYVDKRGHMSFTSTSERLAKDFQFLIWSLGGKATITDRIPQYTYNGQKKNGLRAYTVYFNTKINPELVSIERKKKLAKYEFNGGVSNLNRQLDRIEYIGKHEGQCIKVDNPNGLYLTDDFIVTHNTDAGMVWMVEPAYIANPRYQGLVIRKNSDDLSDWIERAKHMYRPTRATFAGNPPKIRFPSGALIRTGHLKDKNAYTKYQGHEYQKILIEELTQIPRELDYEMLWMSNRSTVPGLKAQMFCTANPGGKGHAWVKRRWVDVAGNKTCWHNTAEGRFSRIFIPSRVYDTPQLLQNDPKYVAMLDSLPEDLRRAWKDGDWDVFAGQYFSKWRRDRHVIAPFKIPHEWPKYRGYDHGYAAPTAVVWIAVDQYNNHYLYRELYVKETVPSIIARKTLEYTQQDETIDLTLADPSIWIRNPLSFNQNSPMPSDKSIADNLIANGLYVQKANNDRVNGWMQMRELIEWNDEQGRKPRFFVFDTCPNTIRTIPELVYDENHPEDIDTDGEDHIADAIRYVVMHTYRHIEPERKKTPEELEYEEVTRETEESGGWLGS